MRKSLVLALAALALTAGRASADPCRTAPVTTSTPTMRTRWRPGVRLQPGQSDRPERSGHRCISTARACRRTSPRRCAICPLSAAAGSSLGQNNLGGLYRDGKGVPRDYVKAAQWFSASAAQGNSAGMYNLGLMYELGQGMKAEPFHAYMWYALAAEPGNMPNAAAHRDALWRRMTPAAQSEARKLVETCKANKYHGCR